MEEQAVETLSLGNICGGAASEVFERELLEILQNIADVNTKAEQKRRITLEFNFAPFPDRSGATVELKCNAKLAPVESVKANVFVFRKGDRVMALPNDPRQQQLFGKQDEPGVARMPAAANQK